MAPSALGEPASATRLRCSAPEELSWPDQGASAARCVQLVGREGQEINRPRVVRVQHADAPSCAASTTIMAPRRCAIPAARRILFTQPVALEAPEMAPSFTWTSCSPPTTCKASSRSPPSPGMAGRCPLQRPCREFRAGVRRSLRSSGPSQTSHPRTRTMLPNTPRIAAETGSQNRHRHREERRHGDRELRQPREDLALGPRHQQ